MRWISPDFSDSVPAVRWAPGLLLLGVLLASAFGCDSQAPEVPTLTGTWRGSSNQLEVFVDLTENEKGRITGSGSGRVGHLGVRIEVEGVHEHPRVTLDGLIAEKTPVHFEGDLESSRLLSGVFDVRGYPSMELVLERVMIGETQDSRPS